mgnify:CR=1 FL=1
MSDNFREGGFFDKGDVLLEIDPADYETALTVAQANLAQARVRLAEEEAQSRQAELDWQRLGGDERPTELVLRVPQLATLQMRKDVPKGVMMVWYLSDSSPLLGRGNHPNWVLYVARELMM